MPAEGYDQTYYAAPYCQPYAYQGLAYAPYQPYVMVPVQYPQMAYVSPPGMMKYSQPSFPSAPEENPETVETQERSNEIIRRYEASGRKTHVLTGNVLTLARTQSGSRFLQGEVTKGDPQFVSFILQEVVLSWNAHRSRPRSSI